MTDRLILERVLDLLGLADRLRLPGHRLTADRCLEAHDEIREGLRRLYRDLAAGRVPRRERRSPTRTLFPAGPIAGTSARTEYRGRVAARA